MLPSIISHVLHTDHGPCMDPHVYSISKPKYTRQSPDCPLVIFSLLLCPPVSLLYIIQLCLCLALHCCFLLSFFYLHMPAPLLLVSFKSIAFRSHVFVTSVTTACNKQWVATLIYWSFNLPFSHLFLLLLFFYFSLRPVQVTNLNCSYLYVQT